MGQANLLQRGQSFDHTPAGALSGGDVVVQNDLLGVTPSDIAASALGALQVGHIYDVDKAASKTFNVGDPVYWDDTNNKATDVATGNTYFGVCTKAAASADARVQVMHKLRSRGESPLLYASEAASAAITNTAVQTAFDKSVSIPANVLKPGDVIRVRLQGIATATNGTDTLNVTLRIGGTDVLTTGALDVANNDTFFIDADITIRTNGAGGTFVAAGLTNIGAEGTSTTKHKSKASTAIDTTAAVVVDATATWSVANAGNSCRLDVINVQLLRK